MIFFLFPINTGQTRANQNNDPKCVLTISYNATKDTHDGHSIHLKFRLFCFYDSIEKQCYSFPRSFIISTYNNFQLLKDLLELKYFYNLDILHGTLYSGKGLSRTQLKLPHRPNHLPVIASPVKCSKVYKSQNCTITSEHKVNKTKY